MNSGFAITIILLWVAAVVGWIMNIVQLVGMINSPITTLFILKVVGIFAAPFGSVMGWIGLFN